MLEVNNLNVSYDYLQVIWDVTLRIGEGELVAILGPNGSGKTTTLKSIVGLLPPKSGSIRFLDRDITGTSTHLLARMGLALIPEERNLFPAMTVEDNLLMGAFCIKDKARINQNLSYVYNLFPRLVERKRQLAGTMSGGDGNAGNRQRADV